MKTVVVIPTYNEKENIQRLIAAINSILPEVHILVVDDSSPDGTAKVVQEIRKDLSKVNLLVRPMKQGLGRAYVDGFKWALQQGYDSIIEMDADFSHRPEDLKKLVATLEQGNVNFVIGSRYIPGGAIESWSWIRWLISKGGSFYTRLVLGYPLRDWTGGFNGWKAEVLKTMGLDNIISNGYSFQIELKYRALKLGFKGQEVPIFFANRSRGQSKMSWRIFIEAFYKIWVIRCA